MLDVLQKNWWLLLLRGFLALVFGFIALFSPGIVLVTLLLYFGFVAIFSGIFIMIEGMAHKDGNRGIRILEGLFYIAVGVSFLIMPGFVLTFIFYFIAFWAILAGAFQIYSAIKLRKVIQNEWLSILNGIISIIFGILVMFNAPAGAQVLIMVFGVYAIISGVLMIALSFKVKNLRTA